MPFRTLLVVAQNSSNVGNSHITAVKRDQGIGRKVTGNMVLLPKDCDRQKNTKQQTLIHSPEAMSNAREKGAPSNVGLYRPDNDQYFFAQGKSENWNAPFSCLGGDGNENPE
jgi:hypothetical protein